MNKAITPHLLRASGGMADTPVLGTGLARGEGSSPFSPTSNSNNTGHKFVAQDVALRKKCCSRKVKGVKGCGSKRFGSLRINTHTPYTFSTAYSSSIATTIIVNRSTCTSG